MITHQAVVIKPEAESFPVTAEEFQEFLAVFVILKDSVLIVATVHDVIAGGFSRLFPARYTAHISPLVSDDELGANGLILPTRKAKSRIVGKWKMYAQYQS
jgi:hypothetical protein